jgi:hypothetical protein
MGDPLRERYDRSFLTKPTGRVSQTPLPSSTVVMLSTRIQSTGQYPGLPPYVEQMLGTLGTVAGWTDGVAVTQQWAPQSVHPTMSGPVPALEPLDRSLNNPRWQADKAEYDILWSLYEAMVADEYAELGKPRASWYAAYGEFQQRGGLALYRSLRPLYYRANIREPHKMIMQMLSSGVRLAGVEVMQGVHPVFARILDRVDKAINKSSFADFGIQPIRYVGCFRPSPLGERISNHMIGAAVDIDATIEGAARNPHLTPKQIAVLDAVIAFRVKQNKLAAAQAPRAAGSWLAGIPADSSVDRGRVLYAQTLQVSKETKAFLDEFLGGWIANDPPRSFGDARDEAFALITQMSAVFGGRKEIFNIQRGGILSIPAEIFEALANDPDLRSGTEYGDLMHFEIRRQVDIIGADGLP